MIVFTLGFARMREIDEEIEEPNNISSMDAQAYKVADGGVDDDGRSKRTGNIIIFTTLSFLSLSSSFST